MQVTVLRACAGSFAATAALNYCAAFNLVGWNFLLPGRYTFGVVSIVCLGLITLWALIWLCQLDRTNALVALAVSVLATVLVSLLIWSGLLPLKDYFIYGLPLSIVTAASFALLMLRSHDSQSSLKISVGMIRASVILGSIAAFSIASSLMGATSDVQQYLKQQAYMLTASVAASFACLFVTQCLKQRGNR